MSLPELSEFLTSHPVENETLIKNDGEPLTIGDVKSKINLWLAELGAENLKTQFLQLGTMLVFHIVRETQVIYFN